MLLGQRDWHDPDAWICSELQAAALECAGILQPFPQGKRYITPESLLTAVAQIKGVNVPPPPIGATNLFGIEKPAAHRDAA